jgi:methyl-accepting chemotaxis protein
MRIGIKTKLLMLGIGSVLITVVVMIVVGIVETNILTTKTTTQVNELIQNETGQVSQDIYNLVQSQDETIQLQVSSGMNVLSKLIADGGGLSEGDKKVDWEAVNQVTKEKIQVQIPELLLGDTAFGKVTDSMSAVPVVDELDMLMDARATIFQPLPDGSGILRAVTNISSAEGKRAIGTYIPLKNADGSPNAVTTAVLGGRDYQGVALVVDDWYVSKYHPIQDINGKVIAFLFVGVKEESVDSLRSAIQNTAVGKTGYVSIVGGKGDQKGKYLLSKGGKLDGQSIFTEAKNGDGKTYQELVEKAITLKVGENASYKTVSEVDGTEKTLLVSYYAPWDWVIIVNSYMADYQSFFDDLKQNQTQLVLTFLLFGIGLAVISFFVITRIAKSISKPIEDLTGFSKKLAIGDIEQDISYQSKDEIGDLAEAFRKMIFYLQEMAGMAVSIADGDLSVQVNARSDKDSIGMAFGRMITNLRKTISDIQSSALQLNNESSQLASGADQITTATSQIATTIQEISQGSIQQAESVNKSAVIMDDLGRSIKRVEKGSNDQADSVADIAMKTSQISSGIQQVESHANAVQEQAKEAAQSASDGYQTVEETLRGMKQIREKVNLSVTRVNEMADRSQEIGKIVETIDDIASQTNLLALNAAIEAARAGEYGKGFAVVADEVRKLAERSSVSTKEIKDLVTRIQATIDDAISAMKDSSNEVDSGVVQAEKSGESLKNILQAAEMVKEQAVMAVEASKQISISADDLVINMSRVADIVSENKSESTTMADNSEMAHDAIENIASISQENSAAVEEVSASTEEVSAEVGEFQSSVQKLSDMAQNLKDIAEKFKIN